MSWFDPIEKALGNFNALKFDKIRRLSLAFEQEPTLNLDIDLQVAYGSKYFIRLLIRNAKQVLIGEIDHSHMQLGELFVDSLKDCGLEGLNYQIHDELGALSCYCEFIEVVEITEKVELIGEKLIWSISNEESER